MSQDTLDVAYRELREWRKKLEQTEAFKKVQLWEAVIRSYGGIADQQTKHNHSNKNRIEQPSLDFLADNKKTQKERVIEYSKDCIRQNGGFASLPRILVYLRERGIDMRAAMLSWYLSTNKDIFIADRSKGWSIK